VSSWARGRIAEGYDWSVDGYLRILDPTLRPAHRRLVELANLRAGDQVLDLCCGTGAITRLAFDHVARVTGIDVSEAMVDAARANSSSSVRFEVADAGALPLPDARFDAVLCGFAPSHLPDVRMALGEVWRVLRSGGRFVESSWGAERANPTFEAVLGALQRYRRGEVHAFAGLLDRDTWAFAEQGIPKVREAGFDRVEVVREHLRGAYADAETALAWVLAWPDYGLTAEALPPAEKAQFRLEALDAIRSADDLAWCFEVNYSSPYGHDLHSTSAPRFDRIPALSRSPPATRFRRGRSLAAYTPSSTRPRATGSSLIPVAESEELTVRPLLELPSDCRGSSSRGAPVP
jgi:SAM-dependent methyltransferase